MNWLSKHKIQIAIGCILLLAAALRLYRISDFMVFLGDEGRDMLVALHMIQGDFTLLGPRSSAADFFYGPAYYYMITPFLWLFRFDPVGPAVMVALFGVATVYLIYRFSREFFGNTSALVSAFLYALAPLPIIYSRSSWNPNPLPFFSLLALYITYKAVELNSWKLMLVVGILIGISLQLHYLALFLLSIIVIYSAFVYLYRSWKKHIKPLLIMYVSLISGIFIGISPFLLFEIRHGFPNSKTIFAFIFTSVSSNQEISNSTPFVQKVYEVFFQLFLRVLTFYPKDLGPFQNTESSLWFLFTILVTISGIVSLWFVHNRKIAFLLAVWLFFGIIQFGFYSKEVHDYLLTFLFPLPFLLVGITVSQLVSQTSLRLFSVSAAIGIIAVITVLYIYHTPVQHHPNRQKNQMKTIAEFVLSKTEGRPYNFALITPGNSDHAYRYYFELNDRKPVTIENILIDPERKSVTDQLLIVCEDVSCQPLGHSLWEVAGFGRAEIAGEWNVSVVKVYKLVPYEEEED